jgi:hypothetical protein
VALEFDTKDNYGNKWLFDPKGVHSVYTEGNCPCSSTKEAIDNYFVSINLQTGGGGRIVTLTACFQWSDQQMDCYERLLKALGVKDALPPAIIS